MAMGWSHKALQAIVRVWGSGGCEKGNCGVVLDSKNTTVQLAFVKAVERTL